jgi:hypothetical protein
MLPPASRPARQQEATAMDVDDPPELDERPTGAAGASDEDEDDASTVMLATQGFDTQGVDDDDEDDGNDEDQGERERDDQPTQAAGGAGTGMTEAEMLVAIFERFDVDADGFLNRAEATAWGKVIAENTMDDGTYRSLVAASLPKGQSQQLDEDEDEDKSHMDAMLARGIDLPGLTRVYAVETENLTVASSYERVVSAVPAPRNLNLRFYRDRYQCSAGVSIEEFFRTWEGDYERLERAHNYVQWLFPSPEASMFNYSSQPLTRVEAEVMRRDPSIQRRLKRSVALFLDFLGLQIDFDAGPADPAAIVRGEDAPARLLNVETNPHK